MLVYSATWMVDFYGKCRRIYHRMDPSRVTYLAPWMIYDSRLVSKVQITSGAYTHDSFRLPEKNGGWKTTCPLGRPIFKGYVSFRKGIHMCFVQWFFTWSKPIISYILWKDREVETNKYNISISSTKGHQNQSQQPLLRSPTVLYLLTCESPRLKRHLCQNEFIFSIPKQRWTYIIL